MTDIEWMILVTAWTALFFGVFATVLVLIEARR